MGARGNLPAANMLAGLASQNALRGDRAADNQRADMQFQLQERRAAQQMEMQARQSQAQITEAQRREEIERERLRLAREGGEREAERFRIQNDPERIAKEAEVRARAAQAAKTGEISAKAREKLQEAEAEAARVTGVVDRFGEVFRQQGGAGIRAFLNDPSDPKAQQLNQAFENLKMVMRSESLMNTGVLQPAEAKMLQDTLLAPTSMRGLLATPDAMQARLNEIKEMVNRGVASQRTVLGREGGSPRRLQFNPATGRIE